MLSTLEERSPKIDQSRAVELEGLHGGPAGGREADDPDGVMTPDEVIEPPVASRVEEGDDLTRYGIDRLGLDVLVIVAALTGQRQVVPSLPSSSLGWNDVLDGKDCVANRSWLRQYSQIPRARERTASLC